MKTLIYSCVFIQSSYIELLTLLFKTYKKYGHAHDRIIDYLVICSPEFKYNIEYIMNVLQVKGDIWCISATNCLEACFARLRIFNYPKIKNYSRILYLDTDILITNNIMNVVNINPGNKLYTLKEGTTTDGIHGSELFDGDKNVSAFTSGILLFNNCRSMNCLFNTIIKHAQYLSKHDPGKLKYMDQPVIVYNAIMSNLYNNTEMEKYVVNNPLEHNGHSISHFPGGVGFGDRKLVIMKRFLADNKALLQN